MISAKPRLAILVNIVAPYRIPIYQALSKGFELVVYYSGYERDRKTWVDLSVGIPVRKVWGVTLVFPQKRKGKVFGLRHFHINPGYFTELIKFKPDAIITNEMGFRSTVALVYGYLFRKPVWVWWGGTLHTEKSIHWVKKLWRKLFIRFVQRWISYGETSTEYLLSLGVPRSKILQVQNCVDETVFSQKVDPLFHLTPRPVLLYVGQLIGRKGLDLLLEAAARVQKKGHIFSLALVGDGPDENRLKEKAKMLRLENIYFLPGQKPSLMPAVYRSGDVLIFPSLEDVWGLVVNEALWSGLPVISSIYAGCTKEIVPPENWFDPLDPGSFDTALEKAIQGKIAQPDTSPLLSCHKVAEMIAEDLKSLLSQ